MLVLHAVALFFDLRARGSIRAGDKEVSQANMVEVHAVLRVSEMSAVLSIRANRVSIMIEQCHMLRVRSKLAGLTIRAQMDVALHVVDVAAVWAAGVAAPHCGALLCWGVVHHHLRHLLGRRRRRRLCALGGCDLYELLLRSKRPKTIGLWRLRRRNRFAAQSGHRGVQAVLLRWCWRC